MKTVERANKRVDLRRNDTVRVITGRDKGKEGRVLRIFPNDAKILVEHVMLVKKHVRPNPAAQREGRHRRAGEPDRDLERGADVSQLQAAGAHRARVSGRAQGPGVPQVRGHAG